MKKLLVGVALPVLLSAAINVYARQLTVDEATALAEGFVLNNLVKNDGSRSSIAEMKLVYSASVSDDVLDETAYYVFDRGTDDGYVIVSGDDRLRPVLGYASVGKFDVDSLPPNMKWWLGEYAREIAAFLCNQDENSAVPIRQPERTESAERNTVAPLVTTIWNQTAPYNDQCPLSLGRKSVTGCVATAMAQIVNYHNWPQGTGAGTYSYTIKLNGVASKVQFNYSATTFAWANMLDDYSAGNPGFSQKMAVANLMLACGVGVHMKYSPDESGAYSFAVPYALINYFKYDSATRMLLRDYYYASEWEDIVYREISEGRPVLYSGTNDAGAGHAFVCDGYGADGLFHINWGWGGYYDDYFALSALNPEGQGTGGNVGGFNYGQDIIVGIKPAASGTGKSNGYILSGGAFTYGDNKFNTSDGVFNYYPQSFKGELGVEVVKSNAVGAGVFVTAGSIDWGAADMATGSLPGYNIGLPVSIVNGLQPGSYKVYPAWKGMAGRWERMLCPVSEQCFVTLTVTSDGKYVYSNEGPVTGISDIIADEGFRVCSRASAVVVSGVAGDVVEIYDLRGVLVAKTKASPDETVISLTPGLYVVRCGGNSKKVSVGSR